MSLALRVLIGLISGFLLGLAIANSSSAAAAAIMAVLAPVGTIFVNLIRMTVIPLVAPMLVAGVATLSSTGGFGRTGLRAALIAFGLLGTAAIGSALIAE